MKKTMNKKYSWLIIGATVVFLLVTSIAAKENYAKVIQSKHGHIVINEETLHVIQHQIWEDYTITPQQKR